MIQLLPVKFECCYPIPNMDPIRHKFSIAHTTTDHVITVKNHQIQSQTKYGKNQYQTFLKLLDFA